MLAIHIFTNAELSPILQGNFRAKRLKYFASSSLFAVSYRRVRRDPFEPRFFASASVQLWSVDPADFYELILREAGPIAIYFFYRRIFL